MGATATIDEMLEFTGGFGCYQWGLLAALCCSMFCIGMQMLVMTFLSAEPAWKCVSSSVKCNYTGMYTSGSKLYSARCKLQEGIDWEYVDSFTSIVTEFKLYCDDAYARRVASSMVYVGWFIGAVVFGSLSDKFGRKKILFLALSFIGTGALIGSFLKNVWLFTACRLIVGAGIGGGMLITFTLSTEFSGPKKRGFAGTTLWFFTTFSLMTSSLLAYLIRSWRMLSIAASIPGLLMMLLWWLVPESARWLLTHGRVDEAEKLFDVIARRNGLIRPQVKLEIPSDLSRQRWGSITELFRNRRVSLYTCLSWAIWFSCALLYFGVSMSAGILSGSMYLNFFLLSIAEIPGNILAIYGMNRLGRKKCLIIGFFGSAIALLCAAFFPRNNVNKGYMAGRVTFAVLAKLFNLVAFDCSYIITTELFPTTLRATGMGTSSAVARVGSFSSSYLIWLNDISHVLPYGIMGFTALLCGCFSFLLPETKDNPTKETMSDGSTSDIVIDEVQLSEVVGSCTNVSMDKGELEITSHHEDGSFNDGEFRLVSKASCYI